MSLYCRYINELLQSLFFRSWIFQQVDFGSQLYYPCEFNFSVSKL